MGRGAKRPRAKAGAGRPLAGQSPKDEDAQIRGLERRLAEASRRGIALEHALDERLGQIRADECKVKQVLLNLLSNALKFTPNGGRIHVEATARDDIAEILVADTRVGIAAEDQQAVFEEFRQVGMAARKSRARAWGSPCAGSSWNSIVGGSGSTARWAWARRSRSRFRGAVANEALPRGAPRLRGRRSRPAPREDGSGRDEVEP
jgi:signal transduction histidine kinase